MLPKKLKPLLFSLLSPILLQSLQDLSVFQMNHQLTHASNGWAWEDFIFFLLPQPDPTRKKPWISWCYAFKSLAILKISVLLFDVQLLVLLEAGGGEGSSMHCRTLSSPPNLYALDRAHHHPNGDSQKCPQWQMSPEGQNRPLLRITDLEFFVKNVHIS